MRSPTAVILLVLSALTGCRSPGNTQFAASYPATPSATAEEPKVTQVDYAESVETPQSGEPLPDGDIAEPLAEAAAEDLRNDPDSVAEEIEAPASETELLPPVSITALAEVVRVHFPVIQEALAARQIASGEVLAAMGAFDHKLDGYSNNQPLDFYENYWHNLGVKRDTFWGGQVFAGYRNGRGVYEPWYLERETNKGGEFKAGFLTPLARDRFIDANRAELWRAELERGRVEPEIRALILRAVRDATVHYWQWVAAGENYRIADEVLNLGLQRVDFLTKQIEVGEKAEIDLVDNQRAILKRQADRVKARQKLQQSAVKLSLFLRNQVGQPVVLPTGVMGQFPTPLPAGAWGETAEIAIAQATRPELEELRIIRRQVNVALRQATNETLPEIDAGILVGQDVGEPTSSKRDKSEFELEATLQLSVPLERRKALGKIRQLRGKLTQVAQKTRFTADKISAEAAAAHAMLVAAAERVVQTTESLALAKRMQEVEQRRFELGESELFDLNLREQQLVEAAIDQVAAKLDYYVALADYAAALGLDTSDELTSLADAPQGELVQPKPMPEPPVDEVIEL